MSENFRGAVLMMICMSAFVLNDAFLRLAGDSLPLAQILFFRGLLTSIVLLLLVVFMPLPPQMNPTLLVPISDFHNYFLSRTKERRV